MFNKIVSVSLLALFLIAVPASSKAQTVDMADALARMNSIIAEMEKLRTEFQSLTRSVGQTETVAAPAVLGAQSSAIFTESLVAGETNNDIKRIQKLLATDSEIYPYGVASGFFGPKTEEAIKNLQARNGWDTPGVIGPATRDLLERYFKAYPDENWPADVLKSAPPAAQVLGASTDANQQLADALQTLAQLQSQEKETTPAVSGNNLADEINVTFDDGEALIEIIYTNGNRKGLVTDTSDEDEVIEYIASRTVLTETMVREVIEFDEVKRSRRSGDEDEADEAISDADDAIDDADAEIEDADADGDDVDWAEDTLRDAKRALSKAEDAYDEGEYDDAIELAEEAKELAKKAEDRIDEEKGGGDGDIDEINVTIGDGESEVEVQYEDGDEDNFTVDEDKEDDIIAAIADELDIDEDEVEDLIDFDYGDVDRIEVRIDEDSALVRIFYDEGFERRLRPNKTDEDDIISYVVKELDIDEDEVEDIITFD